MDRIFCDYKGAGVTIGIYDDGVQRNHNELAESYDVSLQLLLNGVSADPGDGVHGTAVAGIIAARANGYGGVGVASESRIAGVNIFSGVAANSFMTAIEQMAKFDITNNSWGWSSPFADSIHLPGLGPGFSDAMANAAAVGRNGLGTIVVNAAGNDWLFDGRDTNASSFSQDRHTITVGAVTDLGEVAFYSNRGASLLVSAPSSGGVEGIYTADLAGQDGYSGGDTTGSFGGTSAATPIVSGVAALMLEANQKLGWRDVQEILSYSADHVGSRIGGPKVGQEAFGWSINGASNFNGGGLHFSNDYGFGQVDAYTAVRMAEVWSLFGKSKTSANELHLQKDGALDIAIRDAQTSSFSFKMTGAIQIEHVDLTLTLSHADVNQLKVQLISPDGTKSVLLAPATGYSQPQSYWTWTFGAEGFRGEAAAGTWRVQVTDTQKGGVGTIHDYSFDVYGAAQSKNDVFHFTDEFMELAARAPGRRTVTDSDGGADWLDFAAIADDIELDLRVGADFHLSSDGLIRIASGTVIENAVTGDGADILVGNWVGNRLVGNRGDDKLKGLGGNDWLQGGAGDDLLYGGKGADKLEGGEGNDRYYVDHAGDVVIEARKSGNDHVVSTVSFSLAGQHIERLTLDGTAKIDGTGNSLANTIVGNSANNAIDGKAGADRMEGGAGNDRYYVDNVGDVVIEAKGAGNDRVVSTVSFSLAGHIERLKLSGTGDIDGTGNGRDNSITGNTGSNVINGRGGNDILTGRGGADFFVFSDALNEASNVDTITDFQVNLDKICLANTIFVELGADLSASDFVANSTGTATTAAQNILYDTTDGRLFYDPDGTGAAARIQFATLSAGLALDHLDFLVV